MLKYLLVAVVVGVLVWMLTARVRAPGRGTERGKPSGSATAPQTIVACAHCGLHLPASDAVLAGSRAYCSEAHRRLGMGPGADTDTPPPQ